MKIAKIEVTRSEVSEVYVWVPDDADLRKVMYDRELIRKAVTDPETGPDNMDWDKFGWEDSLETTGAEFVTEEEAEGLPIYKP